MASLASTEPDKKPRESTPRDAGIVVSPEELFELYGVYDLDPEVNAEIAVEKGTATEEQREIVARLKAAHEEEARQSAVKVGTRNRAAGRETWLDRGVRAHYRPTTGLGRVPCQVRGEAMRPTLHGRSREARCGTTRRAGSRRTSSSRAGPSDLDDDDAPGLARLQRPEGNVPGGNVSKIAGALA